MFDDILQGIVEGTGGGIGAVLMGYDGIAIDQYFKPWDGVDLQTVAIEFAAIIREIRKTAYILEAGEMEEVSIRTERLLILIRMVTEDIFLALAMDNGGNFGKGRYLLMRDTPRLREAIG
jgi:predicted regulator of Ras-like GTPase activity (Roadblock/LC7/MglB family)